ncbi:MAG: hypothetical protein Q8K65_10315 [Alphaproteobacteria bacterium]|nr:hypothetical protein [Alphaproteobacteria bacterium]
MQSPPSSAADSLSMIKTVFARHARVQEDVLPEAPFLRLLLAGAKNISNVRNSFRGIWRLNAFMDDLQETACVCFGINDGEKEWTPQALAAHIDEKKANPAAQKTLVNKRLKQARQHLLDGMVKSVLFLSLPLGIFFCYAFAGGILRTAGLLIAAAPSLVVFWLCVRDVLLYRRLSEKIGAAGERKHDG